VCYETTKVPANEAVPSEERITEASPVRPNGTQFKMSTTFRAYVDGYCCSNRCLMEAAISFSVVKLAMAS
jgi:hypothetical protein